MLIALYKKDGDFVHNGVIFGDSISVEHKTILQETETFVFFIITYRILNSAFNRQMDYHIHNNEEYWISVETVLNCLNAIYSFKEYIKESYGKKSPFYSEDVIAIADRYYYSYQWYTFICYYRNKMVHQAAFAKDYDLETGDTYIDLDEFYVLLNNDLVHKRNPKQTKHIEHIMCFVEELKKTAPINETTQHHCLQTKYVLYQAFAEIKAMFNEIRSTLYNSTIQNNIQWYLDIIKEIDVEYKDTAVISIDNKVEFYPTRELENIIIALFTDTVGDSSIKEDLYRLLKDNSYNPTWFRWDGDDSLRI